MAAMYEKYGTSVIGCMKTDKPEDTKKYGFAKGRQVEDGVIEVEEIVEKPGPDRVPSNLATISGLYTPGMIPYFERAVKEVEGREPNYIDAITLMLADGKEKVHAMEIKNSKYYDTGSKLGYLKTLVDFGLKHKEAKEGFKKYLTEVVKGIV
jgi:UTP--glucose-1-phosphate uridylyltransferase